MKMLLATALVAMIGTAAKAHTWTAETDKLSLEVRENASFIVKDKRTGREWKTADEYQKKLPELAVKEAKVEGRKLHVTMGASGRRTFTADFELNGDEMTVRFNTDWVAKKSWEIPYPGPIETKKGERIIVPLNEGMGFPADGENEGFKDLSGFSGHGLSMGFYGVTEDETGAGWMTIVEESPEDMRMIVYRDKGLCSVGTRWLSESNAIGYERRQRYVFFERGGYVAMCKRYRKYAKAKGWLKTFREKAKTRPDVLKLPGSVNIWYFQRDAAAMARELREAGIERMIWSGGKHSDASNIIEIAKIPNVLVGRYDLYQGVYPPELIAKCGGHGGYNSEAWPDDILWKGTNAEEWARGWEVKAWDGSKHALAMLCPAKAPEYARRKIPEDLKERPYNTRFLDTTCSTAWMKCNNPKHPLTRRQCRAKRMELLGVLTDELGLVAGTENGHESAVPVCDYFEGMLSIGPYTLPDCGRNMQVIWTNALPKLTAAYSMSEQLRLPLWELVYHDCVCNEYYWGDYNNKMPALWYRKDVMNLLYGTMPMLMFDRKLWKQEKSKFLRSYRMCEPVARATGLYEMTDHRILTKDRKVQQTEFADGTRVTVNFANVPYVCADGYTIPKYEYRVELAGVKEGWRSERFESATNRFFRSKGADGGKIAMETNERMQNGAKILTAKLRYDGEQDAVMTLWYELPFGEGDFEVFTGPDRVRKLPYYGERVSCDSKVYNVGSGRLPRWPLLAAKCAGKAKGLGLMPGMAAVYRLEADPSRRMLRIGFDLGFTAEKRDAEVSAVVFGFDESAEHGYRGAWEKWERIFPAYFESRDKKHGTWMVHRNIGDVNEWEDFGFRYKEGYRDAKWDNAHGVLPLHYSSAGEWNMRFIDHKIEKVESATLEDAIGEAQSQAARGVLQARGWLNSRMLDADGNPAGKALRCGWCTGWSWCVNSAPGIRGEMTDWKVKSGERAFEKFFGEKATEPLAGEYYDSSMMGLTTDIDYDRAHFSAMKMPLTFAKDTHRVGIFKGMVGFEYVKSLNERLHARGKILMANESPKYWAWVAPMCDVLGQEADWLRNGKWKPFSREEFILRRMQSGKKPYCIIQNTDYAAFGKHVEKYMQGCLAYGFMPGFFSPESANNDTHYFAHPEFYERDRAMFRKYVPLCKMVSEAGWRAVNRLLPGVATKEISAEQFGDRYVTLYNHSATEMVKVRLPVAKELISGETVNGEVALKPYECILLEFK